MGYKIRLPLPQVPLEAYRGVAASRLHRDEYRIATLLKS